MTDGSYSVCYIFRIKTFNAINTLRRDKNKRPDGKAISSYINQHNTTNLDKSYVLNAVKTLMEKDLLKNTTTKEGDSYYVVSEGSSSAITSDTNDTESNLNSGKPKEAKEQKDFKKQKMKIKL